MTCIACGKGKWTTQMTTLQGEIHGETFPIYMEALVCSKCGHQSLEGGSMADFMCRTADAYSAKHGLLTSADVLKKLSKTLEAIDGVRSVRVINTDKGFHVRVALDALEFVPYEKVIQQEIELSEKFPDFKIRFDVVAATNPPRRRNGRSAGWCGDEVGCKNHERRNSMKEPDVMNFMAALVPGGIEAQEARGQRAMVNTDILPIKGGSDAILKALGIEKLGRASDAPDELFIKVRLPEGWKRERTDHSMWSKLVDAKGRERASIFYKAAFYDRDAFMSLISRYGINSDYAANGGGLTGYKVIDKCDPAKALATFPCIPRDYKQNDEAHKLAAAWLKEHFPECDNPLAYWG